MIICIKARNDFHKLYEIINKNISSLNYDIILEIEHLEPLDIIILTMFIIHMKQLNCVITLKAESENINKYLHEISLFNFCQSNFDEPNTLEGIPLYTAMPIRRIETNTLQYYTLSTLSFFKQFTGNKDLDMVQLCISELINNVNDHAQSTIGSYIFAQYHSKKNTICFSVGDIGKGIPNVVNEYNVNIGDKILNDVDCIKWALMKEKTTKSMPHNQGRGLEVIDSFIKENKGVCDLYSQSVYMKVKNEKVFNINPIKEFKGTLVQLTINIDNLDSEDDYFNDELWK